MTTNGSSARPAVAARGLVVRRGGTDVLTGLDLDIPTGAVTGLLGPSGCGKTTLLRAITGVQAHVTGTLEVLGRPAGDPGLRRRIGYATQAASVYDDLTAQENVRFFALVLGLDRGRADAALESVGMADQAGRIVRAMSGGQRSRVSLAVALLGEPDLLVLDEPTVGLDPVLRRSLWELFARLAGSGAAVIVSSHVMDEAEHCDRLLLLREGRLLADSTPAELTRRTGTARIEDAFVEMVR